MMPEQLAERIAVRAKEIGGKTSGHITPVVNIFFDKDLQGWGSGPWIATVEVKPPHRRDRYAVGKGTTLDQALHRLAKTVGAL